MIVHDGVRRMYTEQENVFYYITVMNENYAHPSMPENVTAVPIILSILAQVPGFTEDAWWPKAAYSKSFKRPSR